MVNSPLRGLKNKVVAARTSSPIVLDSEESNRLVLGSFAERDYRHFLLPQARDNVQGLEKPAKNLLIFGDVPFNTVTPIYGSGAYAQRNLHRGKQASRMTSSQKHDKTHQRTYGGVTFANGKKVYTGLKTKMGFEQFSYDDRPKEAYVPHHVTLGGSDYDTFEISKPDIVRKEEQLLQPP